MALEVYEVKLFNQNSWLRGKKQISRKPSLEEGMAIALDLLKELEAEQKGTQTEVTKLQLDIENQKITATRVEGYKWRYNWECTVIASFTEQIPKLEQHLTSDSKVIRDAVKESLMVKERYKP